jgi:hypothetical protein
MRRNKSFDPKDYLDFKTSDSVSPPPRVSEQIMSQVRKDLNPSNWQVFSKISKIHFFAALITLSVCPQFGFRVLGSGLGLMEVFMAFGSYGCNVACGSFFIGVTMIASSVLLRPEELRQLKRNSFLEVSLLSFASLGVFIMVGSAEILFSFAVAWLFGSLMSGMALIEVAYFIRTKRAQV